MKSENHERRRYSRSSSRERSVRSRERSSERERSHKRSRHRSRTTRESEFEESRKSSRDRHENRKERDRGFSDRWTAYDSRSPDTAEEDRYYDRSEEEDEEDWERRKERRRPSYARLLERGLEGSVEASPSRDSSDYRDYRDSRSERYSRSHRSHRDIPTSTLYIRGIPEDKDESDLHSLFGKWDGVSEIRVSRDRLTGRPRGFAFVEFKSAEAAEKVVEREGRYVDLDDGSEIVIEYSYDRQPTASQSSQALDWVCDRCQATNFARRSECHQCSTVRPRDPVRVNGDADGPVNVLKVSNLDSNTTEEALHYHISPHVPVKDIRLIMDRQLGAPKGFAFIHFHSVADASRVLHTLQDSCLDGQTRPLRFVFARDRTASRPQASAAASNALEAAQLMSGYSAWTPREFDESALEGKAGEAAPTDRQDDGKLAGGSAASAAENSAFQYDSTSGYYFHAASGFYYDANSGLYYDSSDQAWKQHNPETGQYVAVEAAPSSAAEAAIAATNAAVESMGHLQAPELEKYKPPAEARKRGAVIGSAAKLNPEGVRAAAREAEAREEAKRQQLAKAAKAAAKLQAKQPVPAKQQANGSQQAAAATIGAVKGVIRSSGRWGAGRGANVAQS